MLWWDDLLSHDRVIYWLPYLIIENTASYAMNILPVKYSYTDLNIEYLEIGQLLGHGASL